MGADLLALVRVLEELWTVDTGELEVGAKSLGGVLDAEAFAILVDEKRGGW
ncbi:hypothetical protein POL72_10940 [Sorangium sp. wiwo2]|uniref:Carrier domain-containing protein n=1 Tax=Sorangium atrum TaxID=2995308 RepID=A0ABT5BVT4_9BACT|nr:hypothetical protein [Sorangium aterium]MDC0678251.1 hypothetical protein [Sorangium aterium]